MSWVVKIRPRAKSDLQHAHDWYEERRAGPGNEFLADLADAHRFPYKVFFRIVGQNIIIFRILHGAQHHPRELRP